MWWWICWDKYQYLVTSFSEVWDIVYSFSILFFLPLVGTMVHQRYIFESQPRKGGRNLKSWNCPVYEYYPWFEASYHPSFGEFQGKVGWLSQRFQSKFRLTRIAILKTPWTWLIRIGSLRSLSLARYCLIYFWTTPTGIIRPTYHSSSPTSPLSKSNYVLHPQTT